MSKKSEKKLADLSYEELKELVYDIFSNFDDHKTSIHVSFASQYAKNVHVKPFVVIIDNNLKTTLVSYTRSYDLDVQQDYYVAISELLFLVPSTQPKGFIFVVDRTNKFFDTEKVYPFKFEKSLPLFVVTSTACVCVELEYQLQNNTIHWTDKINYFPVTPEIRDIVVEMLFVYSHIDNPPIKYNDVLSYLVANGTSPLIMDEASPPNETFHIEKGIYTD